MLQEFLLCGYSTTASASAFQAEDEGSIPFTRSSASVVQRIEC